MASSADEERLRTLMVAAQAGDRTAYRALLGDCVPFIRTIARRLGTRPGSVDDAVQDVLLTIHKLLHTYDPGRPFLAWLAAIAKRRTIDILRKQGRQAVREVHAPVEYEAHADEGNDPARAVEDRSEARLVGAAVRDLPEGQRQAVELLALQERSLAEGAELTGRSKTALKVNLHRALKTLRARLGKRDDDD